MNRTVRPTVVVAVLVLTGTFGTARAQEPRRVTLDEALALFARNNLELGMARAGAAEAAALARQISAYPNPTLRGTHEPLSAGDRTYSESYLDLSQRFEWPATRASRRDEAEGTRAAALGRVAADSARIAFRVKEAYAEAVRAESAQGVLERVTEVFRSGQERAAERYAGGDVSLYDLRRIRAERARYDALLADAVLGAASARRTLALLVAPGGDELEVGPAEPLDASPPDVVTTDVEAATEAALARRPEVEAAAAALRSARASVSVAKRGRIPDVTATAGFKTQTDGLEGALLALSLPVPLWDRRGGAVDASEARVAAAEAHLALARRRVEIEVRRTADAYRSLVRRVTLIGAPPPGEADDLLEIARVAYAEGEMELIELLDAAEASREARLAEIRLRADLWTAYYELEWAAGGFDDASNEGDER